jgi:hypothetical protein
MESNSTPNLLGPAVSIDGGATTFMGELILVRIPISIGSQLRDGLVPSTVAGSGISPTSNAQGSQNFAFVRSTTQQSGRSYELEVYPIVSFSDSGGEINGYNDLNEAEEKMLIPLPPLSYSMPTPELFGEPISTGSWTNSRDAWLLVVPTMVIMPPSRPVSVVLFLFICHSEHPDTVQKVYSSCHHDSSGIRSH